jgi:hypothetical protein
VFGKWPDAATGQQRHVGAFRLACLGSRGTCPSQTPIETPTDVKAHGVVSMALGACGLSLEDRVLKEIGTIQSN